MSLLSQKPPKWTRSQPTVEVMRPAPRPHTLHDGTARLRVRSALARRIHRIVHRSRLLGDVTMPATGVFAPGGRLIQARPTSSTADQIRSASLRNNSENHTTGRGRRNTTLRLFDVTTWSPSIPSSSEVYRVYNLRTPGSVSSAACIASKSVAGNEASSRAKKRSFEA